MSLHIHPPLTISVQDRHTSVKSTQWCSFFAVPSSIHPSLVQQLGLTRRPPIGWTEDQDGGRHRLKRRGDRARFGFSVGPHSWKRFLFPPEVRLWSIRRSEGGLALTGGAAAETEAEDARPPGPRYAFIGVRSCDIHAIDIQDRVFVRGEPADPVYSRRRRDAFILAVHCGQAGGTCFCVSMGTGPRADKGFDLALTEIIDGDDHCFAVDVGTERGRDILDQVAHRDATGRERARARDVVRRTAESMGRSHDNTGIKELLYSNMEHPRWDDVAGRCLACGNCTLVCPTCFCSTTEDISDVTGEHAERWRRWDSCFTGAHSHMHGGSATPRPGRATAGG